MDLQQLADTLLDEGMVAVYYGVDVEREVPQVDVQLSNEAFDEPLTLSVSLVKTETDATSGFELVQLYAPIPVQLTEDDLAHLILPVLMTNEQVPLVGFNLHVEVVGFLYYRTVLLAPPGDVGLRLIVEAVWLAAFALDLHAADLIAEVREE
jgi:hypothetical protein